MHEHEDLYYCAKKAVGNGQHLEAAQLYRKLAREVPADKQPLFWLLAAESHNDAGKVEDALADCRSAIARAPNSPKAWRTLGRILMEVGQKSEAKKALNKSLDLSSTTSAHLYLGQIYILDKNLNDAETHCREALSLSPSFDEAFYNLGLVLKLQGRTNEAVDAFQNAIHISPNYAIAFREIGGIQLGQGHFDEAEKNLKKCLSILPNDEKTLSLLAELP